jgi:hypothetical protein
VFAIVDDDETIAHAGQEIKPPPPSVDNYSVSYASHWVLVGSRERSVLGGRRCGHPSVQIIQTSKVTGPTAKDTYNSQSRKSWMRSSVKRSGAIMQASVSWLTIS